jgi:hypothetical protein
LEGKLQKPRIEGQWLDADGVATPLDVPHSKLKSPPPVGKVLSRERAQGQGMGVTHDSASGVVKLSSGEAPSRAQIPVLSPGAAKARIETAQSPEGAGRNCQVVRREEVSAPVEGAIVVPIEVLD